MGSSGSRRWSASSLAASSLGASWRNGSNAGFVPVRKPGKLPADSFEVKYSLEYGSNSLAIHRDAIGMGERVLIVDDLLATGGTAAATVSLVRQLGGEIVGLDFLVELKSLHGPAKAYRSSRALHDPLSLGAPRRSSYNPLSNSEQPCYRCRTFFAVRRSPKE